MPTPHPQAENNNPRLNEKKTMKSRRAARDRQVSIAGCVGVFIGVACLALAEFLFFHQIDINRNYARAVGTVVDMQARVTQSGTQTHFRSAVVEFVAADGSHHEFAQGSSSTGDVSSDKVDVLYDPRNPQDAIVDGFWDRWAAPTILVLIGAPIALAGGFLCLTTWRGARGRKRVRNAPGGINTP
jgi:hypothetical protein